jgi:cytochrome c553
MMKRWFLFVILFTTALFLSIYFYLFKQNNHYQPRTSNPDIIYKDACAGCHGDRGESENLLYPDISRNELAAEDIIEKIKNGGFLMPAFPNIADSTLNILGTYIAEKKYLNRMQNQLTR